MQIEVNTSPSLSSSSPIDKKIKCEMLQGVLNIAGFVPVDRKAYKRQKEKREKEALLSSGSGSTGQSLAKQMAVKGQLGKEKVAADVLVESLQEEEVHMLQDVEDEFARAAELGEVGVESAHLDQLMRERDRAARGDLNSWYRRFRRVGGGGFT